MERVSGEIDRTALPALSHCTVGTAPPHRTYTYIRTASSPGLTPGWECLLHHYFLNSSLTLTLSLLLLPSNNLYLFPPLNLQLSFPHPPLFFLASPPFHTPAVNSQPLTPPPPLPHYRLPPHDQPLNFCAVDYDALL